MRLIVTPAGLNQYPNSYLVVPPVGDRTSDTLTEVQRWVQERGLGRRIEHNVWQFNNHESYSAFLLAWG